MIDFDFEEWCNEQGLLVPLTQAVKLICSNMSVEGDRAAQEVFKKAFEVTYEQGHTDGFENQKPTTEAKYRKAYDGLTKRHNGKNESDKTIDALETVVSMVAVDFVKFESISSPRSHKDEGTAIGLALTGLLKDSITENQKEAPAKALLYLEVAVMYGYQQGWADGSSECVMEELQTANQIVISLMTGSSVEGYDPIMLGLVRHLWEKVTTAPPPTDALVKRITKRVLKFSFEDEHIMAPVRQILELLPQTNRVLGMYILRTAMDTYGEINEGIIEEREKTVIRIDTRTKRLRKALQVAKSPSKKVQ